MSPGIVKVFDIFRDDIDQHNDRRERLIKTSRDITILSKRIIFLLHRLVLEEPVDDQTPGQRAAQCGRQKLGEIKQLFSKMKPELVGEDYWRYQRQVSPGLQEYIEALSFIQYLEDDTLITFAQVQESLCDDDGPFFVLSASDYLLGLSDLTGELMRLAISGLSLKGGRGKALQICSFVRSCKGDLERLVPHISELSKKQQVTNQSLQKIEDACYAIVLRGSEYSLTQEALDAIVSQATWNVGNQYKDNHLDTHDIPIED